MKSILRCKECSAYSMREICACGGTAVKAGPAKYSPEDSYGSYRREAKKKMHEEAGLL